MDPREQQTRFEEVHALLEREHADLQDEAVRLAHIGDTAAMRAHTLRLQQHLADVKTYVAAMRWFERRIGSAA